MDLFSFEKQEFHLPDAQLIYIPNVFSKIEADTYFNAIKTNTNWQHDNITVFGKTYKQPRLTALYGENNLSYSYSNITMHPRPFSKDLLKIKVKIEGISQHSFNTVLLNLYRNGNDSNGWHADNEKVLGENPIIASLSLGEARPFHFKHRTLKTERHKLLLEHGSLLIMKGAMQHHWLHQIAKTKKLIGERINLTFRTLVDY
ncbi:alpha-ketoglutarate-dependent dioxygenase AlkB family protein [Winogradskyella immobilis]|uniref:Alpha-ketoglutarate-dependent dioxygenase AlkB n=1 Tax=Winogradskyella immobilis TaxID=2816852 RepID=A0ABS8EMT4_9FLAO|nr:alpha-ketoglutarate-dependent dioxygenase AlkB [Winogradskyella immobilis]MCC1484516.1 alpha-ketoglutarate-dependent dioxygenase AlkB [Winogradskyella immobilis]MCG0016608.1 alpha-ketoglutarate-dependent dioxygenase AlkB [Winogradskyella immobilis]